MSAVAMYSFSSSTLLLHICSGPCLLDSGFSVWPCSPSSVLIPNTWWPPDPAVLTWGLSEHGSPHLLPSLCHPQISAFPWLLLGSGIPMGALDKIYRGLGLVIRKSLIKLPSYYLIMSIWHEIPSWIPKSAP